MPLPRELGFPALSVPWVAEGAKQTKWIANEYENLSRFDEIVIATDMDEQGELAAREIEQRLGDRCIRVKLPVKDINELLQLQGAEQAKFVLQKSYEDAKWQDPETLRSVAEFSDDITDYFEDKDSRTGGFSMGWSKTEDIDYRFRPSELIGCVGFSGSGKTMFLGSCRSTQSLRTKRYWLRRWRCHQRTFWVECFNRHVLRPTQRSSTAPRLWSGWLKTFGSTSTT